MKRKGNVLTRGLTSGVTYEASVQDYIDNRRRQYERFMRLQAEEDRKRREYERQLKEKQEQDAKRAKEEKERLEKLKKETSAEERESAAVRVQEKLDRGETPDQRDADLFEVSDYKKAINADNKEGWFEKAQKAVKYFPGINLVQPFLIPIYSLIDSDVIAATGQKMNDIQASQFSGNLEKSREDQQLLNTAENYFKGDRTIENMRAVQELGRRKPGLFNRAAVYLNKALDWIGNNSVTGTTGAFLGTDELDKVRKDINFDENTTSEEALKNIAALRNSYKAFDEESYNAYLENHNKAKYYENLLSKEYKRKVDIAEGRMPDENGVVDGSVEFFNFSKLGYQLPGIIAGSISSPSQMVTSFATGAATALGVGATATAAGAAISGTGGLAAPVVYGALSGLGAGTTFGLNQAQGAHENAAEVDEGYMSKVKYALDQHPGIAADFYKMGRLALGEDATDEEIIVAKLANKIPSTNKMVDKLFDEAAIGSQRQYDRDMVATTGDSTIDTALQITPIKFFSTLGKQAIKANLRSSRIARAANRAGEVLNKLNAGDEGALRKAFGEYGALVSGKGAVIGAGVGTALDNTLGRIPKVNTAIKSMAQFDIAKIKRLGPKTSNLAKYGQTILSRGVKSSISEGVEEGKQYWNQQTAIKEFQEGLKNANLSYETHTILGDVLDDFQAGDFAAAGLVQAITEIPMLDVMHYTDTNIIDVAEAIKNIKSGMVGGHGQTTMMTAMNGLGQTVGTQHVINDMELAIQALEQNKLAAQKQFAQDQILSRTNSKHIANAIDYLKNSSSIKLTPKELEDLQARAIEVKGISDSPEMKALAKELGIPKWNYDAFVADYMYHKDNLETERENLHGAARDLDAKANEIKAASEKIENPSETIAEKWSNDDVENNRRYFENQKAEQYKRLQDHLKTLKDKLEKEALTNSQRAEVEQQIASVEEALKKVEESEFKGADKIEYAQARFDRINTVARIRGGVAQLNFLNAILSSMGDENVKGKQFVQEQINATKTLLNSWLTGNKLGDVQLTADNLPEVNRWVNIIARDIERADQDNMAIIGAGAELNEQINALAQAYQEHTKAVLNYNIAADLFNDFVGYDVDGKGNIVSKGTEGSRHVEGNAKEHLEGILAAQDDDARLEQAYKKGFSDYGFAGVYKNESPLVQDQEEQEEAAEPGRRERRNAIRGLGKRIREFATKARNYVSGKWKNVGGKKIFIPDSPSEQSVLDPSENQLDVQDFYNAIVDDYTNAEGSLKWLTDNAIVPDEDGIVKSNAHLLAESYLHTKTLPEGIGLVFGNMDDQVVDITYNGTRIGSVSPVILSDKMSGDAENKIVIKAHGFDLYRIEDEAYLESLVKPEPVVEEGPEVEPEIKQEVEPKPAVSNNTTEQQEAKIQTLIDLAKKMNKKFDSTLKTSSHYFEWIGTGENRKLKLWHRLHDEIGSNFHVGNTNRKNWSDNIKKLYAVVYHKGFSQENQEGTKDIQALLDYLQNYYKSDIANEQLLENIQGYIIYLKQESDEISSTDLYECIKGISEEIAGEAQNKTGNKILDRGTAIDILCRNIFGIDFATVEEAIEYCKGLRMTNRVGVDVAIKDYFTNEAFEQAVKHLLNTKKVYVEDLGYVLWTTPFTIYTEDFTNQDGSHINIAGEIDMLAIDSEGRPIIIDYKTSKDPFFVDGRLSSLFTDVRENSIKSVEEQYINQQSAYIQMLNETTRKETTFDGGFNCDEARILPIQLINEVRGESVGRVDVQFSKDQQLVLHTVPFKELGEKEGLIFDKESYRKKLAELSELYARVDYVADHLNIYYNSNRSNSLAEQIRSIKKDLDSILLSLQEITESDLQQYQVKIENAMRCMIDDYFGNQNKIDEVCRKYSAGEFELNEIDRASKYNNLNWDNPINENDVDKLGGFEAMGVKNRKEYDEKVDELAHVACNGDFQQNATAKLTAIEYQTRQGNDKIAVYATITYKGTTYPPIRLYLSKTTGDQFARDVLDGNNVGANIKTTVGLLSKCSDGNQHYIGESKQLVEAIGGTEENPYGNFMADVNNGNIAVVTFNKTTGVLSTVVNDPESETEIALPRNIKKASTNGHIIINLVPENSISGDPIPIVCNTPKLHDELGKDRANHRSQALVDFLVETVLVGLNEVESGKPLDEKVMYRGEEMPLTYRQILNFFFEPYDSNNGDLIQRPQYQISSPRAGQTARYIKIGDFSKQPSEGGAKIINLDDPKALKDTISSLSIWISTEMASVKWNSAKRGSKQFNEFAKFLSNLEDGEKYYLGDTGIYFDKSDADGTYLGFLAKNGLLTTPFNGFSHPLISINTCQKEEGPTSPAVEESNNNEPEEIKEVSRQPENVAEEGEDFLDNMLHKYSANNPYEESEDEYGPVFHKIQKGRSKLDETAARQYIEKVLGKSFSHLKFADEISSAIVGGLSAGTFIAGQVTANMMKLCRYAQNGTEYHEAFHWAFELIMDPNESNRVRRIVRKQYGITDERAIAEWLADAYMQYVRKIYVPKGNIIQKAFAKIRQWAITLGHIFTSDYQIYRLFNDINSGKFANKPINNEAVLRFQEKFKELNQKNPVQGFEKDGIQYRYQQGPVDHIQNIKQIADLTTMNATFSPAVNYSKNASIIINVKSLLESEDAKELMMWDNTVEQLVKARQNPKTRSLWRRIDNALALRELLDDEHIEKTQEYASAYVDRLIGVKGRDLSVNGQDDSSPETDMDQTYADTESGDNSSYAGSPKEHIVPDHQISRISKTSSRVKLFFATIPRLSSNHKLAVNNFGKIGYYELRDIYQTIQNKYHHILSADALWNAIEADSKSDPMLFSLWGQISRIKKLASKGNDNAIGLLNEIYKSIKSTKQSEEVTKTRKEPNANWVSYRSVDIMVQNNSFAISREFTDTVLGEFNKFYEQVRYKHPETGKDTFGLHVRSKIHDDLSDNNFGREYRDGAYESFFGYTQKNFQTIVEIIDKDTNTPRKVNIRVPIFAIYDIIVSYGTDNQKPLYIKDDSAHGYREASVEDNMTYIKFRLIEALASVGIDVTIDQIDDILETNFNGTGPLQLKRLLTETFTLPDKYNSHKEGAKVTLREAIMKLYQKIKTEEINNGNIIGMRLDPRTGYLINGLDVFRRQQAHMLLSILIAETQQKKYQVVARAVDGKLTYAMSDDNTVTAMCDAIFDKTGDAQCTKIRQMIINDPFNMSNGTAQFGKIQIGSYILPRLKDDDVDYQIVNDGGIETGNNENSSTNSDKRGADTIMGIITKLCQNMIVLAPFADKSTALGIRLKGIKIPGIDYSRATYTFREKDNSDTILADFNSYIESITVDDKGRVILSDKDNELDVTVAQYVLAEYYQAKKAIQDYEDLLRNHGIPGKIDVEEKYRTAFNICKKLMFMSQFSGNYVQNEETGEWTFKPFGVEKGSNKTDLEAAKEMISQFEAIVNDRKSLLQFVNRHINGLMQHELEKLQEYGIIERAKKSQYNPNPRLKNNLLDINIHRCIYTAMNRQKLLNGEKIDAVLGNEQVIRIFMYDIVGKAIISKQESERLFTGQSNLYEIVRDKETRIITTPYQDQAKRIGSFASTGSVGVIENEEYTCAEIPDDKQSIKDQVIRSVYMNEISEYIKTGDLNMDEHPDFDFRFATTDQIKELIPKGFQPLVDAKVKNILRGFVLQKKDGSENKNNVTDGVSFVSADFARRLLKSQGAWNRSIAKAFDRLTSDKREDIQQILNDWQTFNEVWTQVIGTQKYTAVGFRTENVNGQDKVVQYVNKTALFPVFACMCNEKMDAIRRQMESQHVDMLMFESAVKVGAHGNSDFTVDNSGNTTGHFNIYQQKSFFLRKQLNTDPNEKELMKIGIQTVKVALSAAIGEKELEWRGELKDGNDIINQIMDDIKALTEARKSKLQNKLKTPKDVTDYVARFLRGNNVPEPIIEKFQAGVPAEALGIQKHIDTLSAKRIQEDTVRINTPGSAFIQRCVYGVEGPNVKFGSLELNDGEELKVVNSDGSMDCVLSIDYFIEYKRAKVGGKWINGVPHFKLTPGKNKKALTTYDKKTGEERPMSFEEIRQWLKDSGIIGKNAKASILSYRIPTQAVASINALKCVDIIPVVRDTVILPKLFTTITGADFDIDKLFISTVWYNAEKQEDGTYNVTQMQNDTTEEGLSNTVVNDYIDILCATAKKHPEIFYRSIDDDTKLADDVIAWIKEKYPPSERDLLANASGVMHSMPSMQAKVHDEFLAGRQGIGPFALALVNHVLTRIYGIEFKSQNIFLKHKSLARDTDDYGKSIMGWLSAMINKHVDVAKNPDITELNVNDSTFNVVALLLRLGYGRRTFMYLCQDIMRDYAFAINQETSVCKYQKNDSGYNDARGQAYDKIEARYNLKGIREQLIKTKKYSQMDIYQAACHEIFDMNYEGKPLCEYVLEHHGEVPSGITIKIGKGTETLTPQLFQYLNLQLFNYLEDFMAKHVTALQQATVIDNERCITSMIQSEFYKQSVEKVRQSNVFHNVDKLFDDSYIADKINAVTKGTDAIYEACSSMDKDVVTTVAKAIDPNILQYGKDRMNNFLGTVRDGMVAYYGAQFFDDYCKKNNIDVQQLLKVGPKGIVRRLSTIKSQTRSIRSKHRALRDNLLIKGLSVEGIIGEQYESTDDVFYNKHRFMNYQFLRFKYAGQSDDNILADVQQAWDQLLNYPDEDIRTFARDLIVYAFYTSGEMSGNTKLFKYVPPSWRTSNIEVNSEGLSYGDFFTRIKQKKEDQYKSIDDIIDKLCRNLWYKDKFVRKIGISTLIRFEGSDILKSHKRNVQPESFAIGEDAVVSRLDPIFSPIIAGIQYTKEGNAFPIFKGGKDNKDSCPRYLKCYDDHHDPLTTTDDDATCWTLYKLVGFGVYVDMNNVSWNYPIYVQTSTLGEKYYRNNIFEYNNELELNENLDAYEITKEFLSKLGSRTYKEQDINEAIDCLTKMIEAVNYGVKFTLTGQETEIAQQAIDILLDIDDKTGIATTQFQPLRTVDKFQAEKQKALEKQQEKFCKL